MLVLMVVRARVGVSQDFYAAWLIVLGRHQGYRIWPGLPWASKDSSLRTGFGVAIQDHADKVRVRGPGLPRRNRSSQ